MSEPFSVTRSTTIARSVEDVFAFVADPHNDPRWCSRVRSVEQIAGDGPVVGARYRVMHQPVRIRRAMMLDVEVVEREAPTHIRLLERDADGTFDVTLTFEPAGTATRVTQRDEITLSLPEPLRPIARRNVGRHLTEQFAALKRLLEADTIPTKEAPIA